MSAQRRSIQWTLRLTSSKGLRMLESAVLGLATPTLVALLRIAVALALRRRPGSRTDQTAASGSIVVSLAREDLALNREQKDCPMSRSTRRRLEVQILIDAPEPGSGRTSGRPKS
jgi:hypothetical protein